jgi:hypothetical protein
MEVQNIKHILRLIKTGGRCLAIASQTSLNLIFLEFMERF